ncbi:MAG TPA: hypothetical protein DET40_05270 [Lentisphaeria bacterium]|nr:MAG: hypothetical protein A2X45_21865 [Lentisphaerae bacterium GWF2_50_93]HCE42937.1 hypothetical protein [Lentisphaeria bacterium]
MKPKDSGTGMDKSKVVKDSFLSMGWAVEDGKLNTWAKRDNTLSARNLSGSVMVNESTEPEV